MLTMMMMMMIIMITIIMMIVIMIMMLMSLGREEVSSGRDTSATARAQQNFIFIRSKQVFWLRFKIQIEAKTLWRKVKRCLDWSSPSVSRRDTDQKKFILFKISKKEAHQVFLGETLTSINREWRSWRRSMRIMYRLEPFLGGFMRICEDL